VRENQFFGYLTLSNEQLQRLIVRKDKLIESFMNLMNNRAFDAAVSQSTGDINKVYRRFDSIKQLIEEVLS
jgi:flagellar biosynthesis/type III secretory pathway chaperone